MPYRENPSNEDLSRMLTRANEEKEASAVRVKELEAKLTSISAAVKGHDRKVIHVDVSDMKPDEVVGALRSHYDVAERLARLFPHDRELKKWEEEKQEEEIQRIIAKIPKSKPFGETSGDFELLKLDLPHLLGAAKRYAARTGHEKSISLDHSEENSTIWLWVFLTLVSMGTATLLLLFFF